LVDLSADDVDRRIGEKSKAMVTSTLRNLLSILRRAVTRAQARDRVKRNVTLLCDCPVGKGKGRPSKALTMTQAEALLSAAEKSSMRCYVVVALLTGERTEELYALTWEHVDLEGDPSASPPVPPNVKVWRSVRTGGDTKTRKSRRSLAMPQRAVDALTAHRVAQDAARQTAGKRWQDHGLVFPTTRELHRMTPMSDATSDASSQQPVWQPPSGPPASYGTASSHCSFRRRHAPGEDLTPGGPQRDVSY
jgi:integrase